MGLVLPIISGLLGAAVGSFLNVVIDRLPAGRSLAYPPSHCDACQRRLTPPDLVPVFSYLFLRGRCRSCGAHIPLRVFLVELAAGLFFGLALWWYGPGFTFALNAFFFCIFLALAVIDIEKGLILNRIVYPAAAIALGVSFLTMGPVSSLIGGGIGLAILLIPALLKPEGMGWGDIKMAGLMGLIAGFPLVFVAVVGGIILGGALGLGLLALKLKKRREAIPFGPFLAVGAVVTLIWGNLIMDWYLGLL